MKKRSAHLGGAVLGIVVLLAVLVVVLLVLGVLLAGRRLGHQQGENGHQDGVQHLLLQDGLENNNNFINMARIKKNLKNAQSALHLKQRINNKTFKNRKINGGKKCMN